MTTSVRRSPLHHRAPLASADGAVRLEERPFLAKLVLRGRHGAIAAPVAEATGLALPERSPGTAAANGATALWLSPDEWMLIGAEDAEADLAARLGAALKDVHHQVADVTDYYTVIALAGAPARTMLMKLTMLDMHPRAFTAGDVRGTMLAHAQATLHQRLDDAAEAGPAFDVLVRWSLADYLWCQIAEAGREFGLPAQEPVSGERLVI